VSESMLSAVITCYRDAEAIPVMYTRLRDVFASLKVRYEIIFVNDASPDAADVVLKELTAKDPQVFAIEHSRNFGSQSAFFSGMQLAVGDAVILLDGDLQDPPELISAFYEKWREGNDVVYGRRSRREGTPLFALSARIFYRVFRRVSDVPMPLDAGDFALMDRKVVDELLALPETDQFLRGLRAWVGFTQTGVDYVRPKRAFGRSTHTWLKNFWWARKGIFSFTSAPIEVLGYVGGTLTLASTCALAAQIVDTLRRPGATFGTSTVVLVVAFFGSLNLLAISIIGEYVIKTLEEAKRRPKFIRKAIRHGDQHLVTAQEIGRFVQLRAIAAARHPPHVPVFPDNQNPTRERDGVED
jgi:polyisoprenyl-phosphate glycosyltransferase